ncbi:septation ring formation regulator EzrA [Litchfieldia salsa]|uniref:Septation ring formation regulator EzrA n=1 Tax=Litchfieldia salsa TaxID=930152 RepID=A0A1H0P583_9BACI|nr:septation ring formation regulator EzrA [Litchfieldia salsa]SDP00121.1 septation ring formation regulator [Litchfieldia salsa]
MEYLIGIFIIIISIAIYGFYFRKKIYQEVDRLELWKIEITNRPVTDEISKVKELNMTGETEDLFEQWRKEWDEIVTLHLPNVEEYLFDAEEFADKYQFKKAKKVLQQIEDNLTHTDTSINRILDELNELIGSEEKNRVEVEELKQSHRELKKVLLAHRHTFGQAELQLELKLDEINQKFKEFDESTKQGNYLQAREMVLFVKSLLSSLTKKMDDIPGLLAECQTSLPKKLDEISDGHDEMRNQGYILDHIQVVKETERIRTQLSYFIELIEKIETEEVKTGIEEVRESIETLYDLLEKEVEANQFIQSELAQIEENLQTLIEQSKESEYETQLVQQSYQLTEKDLDAHRQIIKKLALLFKQFVIIRDKLSEEHVAYSIVKEELETVYTSLQDLKEKHLQYCEMIQALRKDELAAREKVAEMQKKLHDIKRLLLKNNIPGLPVSYGEILNETKLAVEEVLIRLNETPLNMVAVSESLNFAEDLVTKTFELTEEMIDRVYLAEKVIQYGNRYRSRHQRIANSLDEAESLFRSFEYQQALEQAATALEELEPGVLKRIEEHIASE